MRGRALVLLGLREGKDIERERKSWRRERQSGLCRARKMAKKKSSGQIVSAREGREHFLRSRTSRRGSGRTEAKPGAGRKVMRGRRRRNKTGREIGPID